MALDPETGEPKPASLEKDPDGNFVLRMYDAAPHAFDPALEAKRVITSISMWRLGKWNRMTKKCSKEEKKMHRITLFETDGWSALYLDGVLVDQGHELRLVQILEHVLRATGVEYELEEEWFEDEDMEDYGTKFPETLG